MTWLNRKGHAADRGLSRPIMVEQFASTSCRHMFGQRIGQNIPARYESPSRHDVGAFRCGEQRLEMGRDNLEHVDRVHGAIIHELPSVRGCVVADHMQATTRCQRCKDHSIAEISSKG